MKYTPLLFAFALAACSGTMNGQVRGSGERVQFSYEQGLDHDIYKATIGSENFSGKAIMDGASTTQSTLWGSGTANILGVTTTNRFVAVLLGNQGSSLNCHMRYADSSGLTSVGGVGVCKHSDGRIIDVVW